ncbi:peptidase inhibitor family I36 protein [Nonomuraea sp. NPDC050790]|uniref:peptidase inhibitor family I36 protein n=1 Tax=Nonomuraea sp. NPDC050790 TaxID=3364371 RepID=UPI0037BCB31F
MPSIRTSMLVGAVALGAMLTFLPAGAQAASAAMAAPDSCGSIWVGWVCFYSDKDYKGSVCRWELADRNTLSDSDGASCSWMARGNSPDSIYNNGTSDDGSTGVAYYRRTDFSGRIGCTKNGKGGNIDISVPHSLQWVWGSCGS